MVIHHHFRDVIVIQEGMAEKLGSAIQFLTMFVAGFIIGFVRQWKMALVILSVVPLLGVCGAIIGRIMSTFSTRGQKAYAKAGAVAQEVAMPRRLPPLIEKKNYSFPKKKKKKNRSSRPSALSPRSTARPKSLTATVWRSVLRSTMPSRAVTSAVSRSASCSSSCFRRTASPSGTVPRSSTLARSRPVVSSTSSLPSSWAQWVSARPRPASPPSPLPVAPPMRSSRRLTVCPISTLCPRLAKSPRRSRATSHSRVSSSTTPSAPRCPSSRASPSRSPPARRSPLSVPLAAVLFSKTEK